MSSNRSPAASRTQPTFWAVASAVAVAPSWVPIEPERRSKFTLTMSASRPARVRMRRPPPPTRMGGRGRWTGTGVPGWPVTV